MRLFVLGVVILAVAACSSDTTPTGTKTAPPSASFDTLSKGSIPSTGGTITVSKPGDPLNGLTLTVPSGAFSGALNVTIGSSTNKNLPTANGIVPISPVVHVVTSAGGYAKGAITFKIPATVAANTFPVVVLYDSATKTIEPMTTIAYDKSSVMAVTGHLSQATIPSLSAARVVGRSRSMAGGTSGSHPDSLYMAFGVYAISYKVLYQDWDTHFRPGINDWEMPALGTEPARGGALLGVAATELWYFNAQASPTPLNGRFSRIRNAPLSDTIGYHWVSAINNQVDNEFNSFASSAYKTVTDSAAFALRDSMQFDQIRASFAIPTLNAGRPLPVLVDVQSSFDGFYYLIAYRATGNQIYVADPVSPGDSGRFLQLGSGGMTPYVNPAYKPGVSFTTPLGTQLGTAIPLAPLASSYADATAGTVGTSLFPTSGFYSWSGQLYDTMYVVDSLRFWAQCATCQYGFTSTLSPVPAGNVESSYNIYRISGGLVTDSNGFLGANGLLSTKASIAPGTQSTFGVPLASADAAGTDPSSGRKRWLDWHQFTITNLQGTVAVPTGGILVNSPDTLQVSFQPNLLPADVAYQWSFGDSTPTVTVQNNAAVQHAYAKSGTLTTTVEVIDNRNKQVIARVDTTLNSNNVELWVIQSFKWLRTTVNGVVSDTAPPTLAFTIQPGTVPTLIALNGPPFPGGYYPEAGFGVAFPPDSAQEWAQVSPIPLAISAAYPPIDVFAYTNTGTATSGTITGQSIEAHTGAVTNSGYTVNLTKKGTMLSGYIMLQGTATIKTVPTTVVVVDTIVATRVP